MNDPSSIQPYSLSGDKKEDTCKHITLRINRFIHIWSLEQLTYLLFLKHQRTNSVTHRPSILFNGYNIRIETDTVVITIQSVPMLIQKITRYNADRPVFVGTLSSRKLCKTLNGHLSTFKFSVLVNVR